MSKGKNITPRGEQNNQTGKDFKDLPRFNALVNKVRKDREQRRTGVKHNG